MMNDQFKAFAHKIASDLVTNRIVVQDVGGTITLVRPIWGYQSNTPFKDEQQAITQLENAILAQYGGLKVA